MYLESKGLDIHATYSNGQNVVWSVLLSPVNSQIKLEILKYLRGKKVDFNVRAKNGKRPGSIFKRPGRYTNFTNPDENFKALVVELLDGGCDPWWDTTQRSYVEDIKQWKTPADVKNGSVVKRS